MKIQYWRKSNGLLYAIGESLLHWQLNNQFRRIYTDNLEAIPPDAPVLLAANHPTAFVDPVIIGRLSAVPVFFMTRGDIFQKKLVRKILESFHMFPVNRLRDGFKDPNRHDEMTEHVMGLMEKKRIAVIFPEGQHHSDKRILPAQKGIARLAFATYEKHRQHDLQILPVGCTYWYADRIRDVVYLNVGEPIFIRDWWERYEAAPAATILQLCKTIQDKLKLIALHIDNEEDDALCEQLMTLSRGSHPPGFFPVHLHSLKRFNTEKLLLQSVNEMDVAAKDLLKIKIGQYFDLLKDAKLTDEGLMNPGWFGAPNFAVLLLGFPAFVLGWLGIKPVQLLANAVVQKKVSKLEFKSSVYLGIELFAGAFWYLLLIIFALIWGSPAIVAISLLMPLLGWFSLVYLEVLERFLLGWKGRNNPKRQELLQFREELLQIIP